MKSARDLLQYLSESDGFAAGNLAKSFATLARHGDAFDRSRALQQLTRNMIDGAKEYSRRYGRGESDWRAMFSHDICARAATLALDSRVTPSKVQYGDAPRVADSE